jgi:hypothetical protein
LRCSRHGKGLSAHQLNLYLKRLLILLDLVNGETDPKKMPSVAGFRKTFPEWACELSEADNMAISPSAVITEYRLEFVEAQLGHDLKVNNKMYYKNVTYIGRRGAMMEDWEIYCDALRDIPVDSINVTKINHARSLVPAHSKKKEVNAMQTTVVELTPLLVPVKQACTIIGRGQSELYELIGAGKITAVKSDGRTLVVVDSLHKYVASLQPAKIAPPRRRKPQHLRQAEAAANP